MRILKLSILFLVFLSTTSVLAQKKVELYRSMSDYLQNKYDTVNGIIIEKRTHGQIYMVGGNDYKILSSNKTLNKSLKREVWAVNSHDSLYINCFHFQLGLWYAYAEQINDNLYFTAAITMDKEERQRIAMMGVVGGPIAAGLSGGALALERYYYFLNLNTGQSHYLTKANMLEIIGAFPDLVDKYKLEKEPESIDTLRFYLAEFKKRK